MAIQTEASEHPETTPASERRARALTPDDEAMLLMQKILDRTAVAKSFAKIATGFVLGSAAVAAQHLRVATDAKVRAAGLDARLERVRKIARAATQAAVHVAKHREAPAEATPEAAAAEDGT